MTSAYAEKVSARLLAAAAGICTAKIDNPAASEVPLRNREHGGILVSNLKSANCKLFAN